MRDEHVARAIEWKNLNPNYEVIVWSERKFKNEITAQLDNTGITVNSVDQLLIPENILKLINDLINYNDPNKKTNFAAPSDLYRFLILLAGGWYVDTDIIPILLDKIPINSNLEFMVNADRENNQVKKLEPSVMACSKDNILIKMALELMKGICDILHERKFIDFGINSRFATVRMNATMWTTGSILRLALSKILVKGKPVLHFNDALERIIPDVNLYDSVTTNFSNIIEHSWIFSNLDQQGLNLMAHKGVYIDPFFYKPYDYADMFPSEANYIYDVQRIIRHLHINTPAVISQAKNSEAEDILFTSFNLFYQPPEINNINIMDRTLSHESLSKS